ncbi:MAG: YCF48-related protein, partial [Planctomycetota bacterium]
PQLLALAPSWLPAVRLPAVRLPAVRQFVLSLLLLIPLATLSFPSSVPAETPSAAPELLHDAELNDLFFLDANSGWAVGDRGAIWRTTDAGRSWRIQESPANCRWECIHFVDERNGWIAGTAVQPHTWQSRGVLLRTRDGGQNWMPVPIPTLPGLRRLQFVNERLGWATGDSSALYPSGAFRTEDGGRSWTPVTISPGNSSASDSQPPLIREREASQLLPPDDRHRPARNVRLGSPAFGWLVGDEGLILQSRNPGLTWQLPANLPSPTLLEQFDWQAIATYGPRCWIAGAPGTHILSTTDGGKTWSLSPTGQTAPLRALLFVDEERGWAVGSLGTILSTTDGGRTWKVQRSAGRLAILAIQATPDRLPLELLASLSGNDGYLSGAEVIFQRPASQPSSLLAPLATRTQSAVVAVGGSTAHLSERFPAPTRGLSFALDEAKLDSYLIRLIRQWRPEIVVIDTPSRRDFDLAESRLHQLTTLAVQRAAQVDVHPEQLESLGLPAWRVKKLVQAVADDERGSLNLSTSQLLPRHGKSIADVAATGQRFLRPLTAANSIPTNLGFRLAIDLVPQDLGRRDFMSGIALTAGGDGRRNLNSTSSSELPALNRVAQQQRNIQALLTRSMANPAQTTAWLRQIDDLCRGHNKAAVGELLWQLAQRFQQQGQLELAAHALEELVRRDARHELAEPALVWLIQYHASEELSWRRERMQVATLTGNANQQAGAVMVSPVRRVGRSPLDNDDSKVVPAGTTPELTPSFATKAGHATDLTRRNSDEKRASSLETAREQLERSQPTWSVEPSVRLPSAAWLRRADRATEAALFLKTLAGSRTADTWAACAQNELWLARTNSETGNSQPTNGRPTASLSRQTTRPRLDGDLSDEIWTHATRLLLRSTTAPDSSSPEMSTTAWLTLDGEFLYLAARCLKTTPPTAASTATEMATSNTQSATTGRTRDADLRDRDRLDFLLDVDRDYTTAWQLTIDDRGWTAESCWGDRSWNPTWYVAQAETDEHWIVEAAIPLEELAARPPAAGQAWSIQVQRMIPGRDLEAWSQPATYPPRLDGSGLLLFR